jgi:hypothetical protein
MLTPSARWAAALLLFPAMASAGSLELRLRVDDQGVVVMDAQPSDAAPDAWVAGSPTLTTRDAQGLLVGQASLPDPRLRTVIAPEGGHGHAATLPSGIVRVRVPWTLGASVSLSDLDDRPDAPLLLPDLEAPTPLERHPAPPRATQILGSGPSADRLDLVFIGDGYRSDQQEDFREDVDRIVEYLLSIDPYGPYADLFNIWRVEIDSAASGASHDELRPPTSVNTALGCAYGCGGIDRLICCDDDAVLTAIDAAVPGADGIMVLVNDPTYGGSGGFNYATSYVGGPGDLVVPTQVAAHELGHSLVGLWDEYGYGSRGSDSGPNCSPDPSGSWDPWVGTNGVDAFQECSWTNLYRPTLDECMMRTLRDDYCPVCRQETVLAMYRRLPSLVNAVSTPPGPLVVTRAQSDATLDVTTNAPAERLTFRWTLDGVAIAEGPSLKVGCSGWSGELWLDVSDETPWVREAGENLLNERVGPWQLDAERCRAAKDPAPTSCSAIGPASASGALGLIAVGLVRRSRRR